MNIGFIGFKQIGKSTAARYLEEKHGFVRLNMKDALVAEMKETLHETLQAIADCYNRENITHGILDNNWDIDRLFREKPPMMRELMQNYGTDVRRSDDPNYWVKQWIASAKNVKNVAIDDVRFKNEANAVTSNNGVLIRLTRPDVVTGGEHASEMEQLDIVADYTIDCVEGDLQSLYDQLDKIVIDLR